MPFAAIGQQSITVNGHAYSGIGQWSYNKGYSDGDSTGLVGYGRSHSSLMSAFSIEVSYRCKKSAVGINGTYRQLWDKNMIGSTHSRYHRDIDSISLNSVNFIQLGISGEYYLISKQHFEFGPRLDIGYSQIQTLLDKQYGLQGYWSVSIIGRWWMSERWGLTFQPTYHQTFALPKKEAAPGERHDIYGVLAGLSINYRIKLSSE